VNPKWCAFGIHIGNSQARPVRPACNSGCGGEWAHLSSGKARWLLEVSGEARAHYGERNAKCSGCGAQTKQSNRCHLKPSRQPRGIPIIAPEPCSAVNPSRAGAETLSSNAWIRPPARHELAILRRARLGSAIPPI